MVEFQILKLVIHQKKKKLNIMIKNKRDHSLYIKGNNIVKNSFLVEVTFKTMSSFIMSETITFEKLNAGLILVF